MNFKWNASLLYLLLLLHLFFLLHLLHFLLLKGVKYFQIITFVFLTWVFFKLIFQTGFPFIKSTHKIFIALLSCIIPNLILTTEAKKLIENACRWLWILENFYFDRSMSRCILAFRIKNILLRKLRVKIFLTKHRALTSLANEFSHTRSSLLFCQKSRKKKCYCNILSIFTAFFCVFETTSSIYKN